jgi:hypothetical protein
MIKTHTIDMQIYKTGTNLRDNAVPWMQNRCVPNSFRPFLTALRPLYGTSSLYDNAALEGGTRTGLHL